MKRLAVRSAAAASAMLMTLSMGASAQGAPGASTLGLTFDQQSPRTPTALTLHITYRRPADPEGKPSPIRHLEIDAPAGTTFDTTAVAACTATDPEIPPVGRSACPSASQVGSGTLTVMEGFGPPID